MARTAPVTVSSGSARRAERLVFRLDKWRHAVEIRFIVDSLENASWLVIPLIGLIAGFIDAIAGGGGLVSLPTLLAVGGLDPITALATNKVNATAGALAAAYGYSKQGLSSRIAIRAAVPTILGAFLGTFLAAVVDARMLGAIVPILLLGALICTMSMPATSIERRRTVEPRVFDYAFGGGIGFYDGFFGPGTGSLWLMSLIRFAGLELRAAAAKAKALNLISNVVALACFAIWGHVEWRTGLLMASAQTIGSIIGARAAARHGAKVIRPFLIGVVLITSLQATGAWIWLKFGAGK